VRERAQEHHRQAIRDAMRRYDFDLIHMHSLDFHAYLPPPGPPVLVTLHLPPSWYPEHVFRIERPGTRLVCVSASQEAACPASTVLLPHVANGVDLDRLSTSVRKRCYALALGRICPEKGYHLALDAAAAARIPLVLAGELFRYRAHEDYFETELKPRLDGRNRRFIGPVALERKRRLLAGARCLLVPSLVSETSSLVSMEAMACGTPVIAFPSGALSEIVEHGRTGYLVNDVHEMAEAIRAVGAIDPEECRRVARERFSSRSMLARYFEVYEKLVKLAPAAAGSVRT
jgi:glycosyltransferase involved in cell wall biosynthesis